MLQEKKYIVVGAGLAGAVLARELVENLDCKVIILEASPHVGGHCHTERDQSSGILLHKFGPHIFNTSRSDVWKYVNYFATFKPFTNRVKAVTKHGVYSLPINLHTINQFFKKQFTPMEAKNFVSRLGDSSIKEPKNFEEQALKFIGQELYEVFLYGYTKKQWGCEPKELPASILKRLPVRFNYNDNYYDSVFQGIPVEGYTGMIENILDHYKIEISLNTTFNKSSDFECDHLFYTGPIDSFFNYKFGRLGYRTVIFERIDAPGDFQGNAQVNHPDIEVPYTRSYEHKHFAPWESYRDTVVFREFSKETGISDVPFYPKRLAGDLEMLSKYHELAQAENKVSFLGRLGTYRYLNMDQVIGESLDFAFDFIQQNA